MHFIRIYVIFQGGRQYDDEGRRRNDDDQPPRRGGGGGYSGTSRRDYDSNRGNRYSHTERGMERKRFLIYF